MDQRTFRRSLAGLPLGEVRFFERTGSTNDVALTWAAQGVPDLSLVYAEEQTTGRGRGERRWLTAAGAGLAFSLILRPGRFPVENPAVYSALGALSVCAALEELALSPKIKWPNDVLLNGRKVCGILVESVWLGQELDRLVLGLGVNVQSGSVPPGDGLVFPATCVEEELGRAVDRAGLLHSILQHLLAWRGRAAGPDFWRKYEQTMAFRGERVTVFSEGISPVEGVVSGVDVDGSLLLVMADGSQVRMHAGEMHLRPVV